MTANMWDQRFSEPGYAYGTRANAFLKASAGSIPMGRVLSLAEGEGRNAVFLASLGYDVTAVDSSVVGLAKAQALAADRGLQITIVEADLAGYVIDDEGWQGIVSIFCHLPPALRRSIHARCIDGLAPGGALVLEGFTRRQLELKTGGPRDPLLLMSREMLEDELDGLDFKFLQEIERPIEEGKYHKGQAAVVQCVGIKNPV